MTVKRTKVVISITGMGIACLFVLQANAGILFQDSFETGDLSHTENGVSWGASNGLNNGADKPVVSADMAKSGAHSLKFKFYGVPANQDSWSEQRFSLGGHYSELWIKYDLYIPTNYYHRGTQMAANNNKALFQIWGNMPNLNHNNPQAMGFESWPQVSTGSSLLSSHVNPFGNDQGHVTDGTYFVDRATDLGKWIEWIIQVKVASSANNDGIISVWKNGLQIVRLSNVSNYVPGFNWFSAGYLLGWANSGFNQDTYLYIDNVVIANSPLANN